MSFQEGQLFSTQYFQELVNDGFVVDGRSGGLLLGPSHSEGGVVCGALTEQGFYLLWELEGYEYVLSKESTSKYSIEIQKINNHKRDLIEPFLPPIITNVTKVIDARINCTKYHAKFVILSRSGGNAIINKHSTRIFLNSLNLINL